MQTADAPAPETDGAILCLGEVLWDSLPAGLFPGGAPYNVACHLRALGKEAHLVSRVGDDRLGEEILRRLGARGMAQTLVQRDAALPTGIARVELDDRGVPRFDILAPAAWDALEPRADLLRRAAAARAVVYGTLAQRAPATAEVVRRVCAEAPFRALDVNLRPPYDDPEVVERSLEWADLVKLSEDEVSRLSTRLGLPRGIRPAAVAIAERFGSRWVCVTRGERGAVLWAEGEWVEAPAVAVQVVDTVGAGDAFLASLLADLLDGVPPDAALRAANVIGAFVATRHGATPAYHRRDVESFAAGFIS